MNEFEIINRYFKQPFKNITQLKEQSYLNSPKIKLGIGDDCAILENHGEFQIVTSVDQCIESVHFFSNLSAKCIAKKSLTRAISDLMAMAAIPLAFNLTIATPIKDELWFQSFSLGLLEIAKHYQIALIGGDLSKSSQTMITIQVIGFVKSNQALLRNQLKIGDQLFVTGKIGHPSLILKKIKKQEKASDSLINEFNQLNPVDLPIRFASSLWGISKCGIDISDGLLQDISHLLNQSGCGINIDLKQIEQHALHQKVKLKMLAYKNETNDKKVMKLIELINQGEDYQLVFSCNPKNESYVRALAKEQQTEITLIGHATEVKKVVLNYQNQSFAFEINDKRLKAYQHF